MTSSLQKKIKKIFSLKKTILARAARVSLWFSLGAVVGFFFFVSFLYITYRQTHTNLVYEGVMVNGIDFGGKTQEQVKTYYAQKNKYIRNTTLSLTHKDLVATVSAKEIEFGFDENLLSQQAYSIGRSDNMFSNISLMLQAYVAGINLSPAYHYKEDKLNKLLSPIQKQIDVKPVDALFNFEDGRVKTFKLSSDGKTVAMDELKQEIIRNLSSTNTTPVAQKITIEIPVKITKPKITTEKINNMGIKELIGQGTSLFYHSIPNRIYNLTLASSKLNGVLIAPGETFSTTKTIGDISAATGYKQAYVIASGKTVLGDGGGVCQVSTTLFRAALNAGLPIVERNPHAYRVSYYEEDSGPGIDAAIYYPTVDLKFKNDTGHYILIQTYVDPVNQQLTYNLYGTSDNRQTVISQPVILSQSPAPEALYQDDPTLPKGEVKQVDFAASGASVYFTRTVTRDGKQIISDKFVSNYRPWQAIYLRGTKE
jgi:vancomycin resistance protein YoaR